MLGTNKISNNKRKQRTNENIENAINDVVNGELSVLRAANNHG